MLGLLHLFQEAKGRPLRFGELEATLAVSPKTLSQRLRSLVEAGFLVRRAYNEIPPRVEYAPTAKTDELGSLFSLLEGWAARNTMTATPSVATVGRVAR